MFRRIGPGPQTSIPIESSQDIEFQRQHDEVFGTLGLVRANYDGTRRARLIRLYDDFLSCTRAHFASEELLLAHFQPRRLPAHRIEHDAILRRAVELRRQLPGLDAARFLLQLHLVECWLSDHCIDEGASLV